MIDSRKKIQDLIAFLYGDEQKNKLTERLWQRLEAFMRVYPHTRSGASQEQLSEKDVILITYADQFHELQRPPLQTLQTFLQEILGGTINGVHILPFYPYSSDDGFSVIDYRQVAPELGTWQDVSRLGENFRLMFDIVANHTSARSEWFQKFIAGEEPYTSYFPVLDQDTDLSKTVRPRATPVLTPFETANGLRHVWTTFSADQIDLDYSNPLVLLEMIDVLLFYVAQGACIIRLDAIAFLWKIPGTSCLHLPQTHAIVKLFRAILDVVAPSVILITETNVPHQENISYFGNYRPDLKRSDEAQMVYQFPLAPLILHTFLTGDASRLTDWALGLPELSPGMTFFNFTASHDGIGLRPVEGLLLADEIEALIQTTLAHSGKVSYRLKPDGSHSAYEMNITWYDALNDPAAPEPATDISRFLASQFIMLSLAGVPGIYIHSLFGSSNCQVCTGETGKARSLNREKFDFAALKFRLAQPDSREVQVLAAFLRLIKTRIQQAAFHPSGAQVVLANDPAVFSLLRRSPDGKQTVLCLANVTSTTHRFRLNLQPGLLDINSIWRDLLSGQTYFATPNGLEIGLEPYQTHWLSVVDPG